MESVSIIGIGIATMDIYCYKNKMYPGGNEYNIAYNAKKQGAKAAFMGVFANDKVGEILEETLQKEQIDTSHSHHEEGSSGYALVDLKDGDRVFIDWNKKGVTDLYPFEFTKEEIEYIKEFDIACISWGARVNHEKIKKLAKYGVKICYDFYDNFTLDDIREIGPNIKYAFLSCGHLSEEETKETLKEVISTGCEIAVGTRGADKTVAYDGKEFYMQPVKKVKAIDTMGAGDSYISAFLMNYLQMKADESMKSWNNIKQALEKAAEYAATIVVKEGALGIGYDVNPKKLSEIINI